MRIVQTRDGPLQGTQVPVGIPPPMSHSRRAVARLSSVTMSRILPRRRAWLRLGVVALTLSVWCVGDQTRRVSASGSWVVKPPPGTAIDISSPLASGLVGVWHFDSGATPLNLANPALSGVYRGSPTLSPTQDGIGMTVRTDAD